MNTWRRFLCLLVCCAALVGFIPARVYAEEPVTEVELVEEISEDAPVMLAAEDDLTWVLDSNGKLTISGTGSMSYEIPWKAYNSQITEVVIGEGVTSISDSAFYECFNLTSVSLPSTLKTIGYSAFYRCQKLPSIRIPAGVTSIYSSAFRTCNAMTGIWVDEANTTYSSDASGVLYNKDKTELILCPRGFSGSYEIPNSVATIQSAAFEDCTELTNVSIPSSVATIGSSAFSDCDSLTSVVIPGSVVGLGSEAFAYCNSLTSVTIESGLVSLGDYAFYGCKVLTDVKLPDTLVSIGESCFYVCDVLTSITIPGKVSHIDYYAFSGCPLTEVRFEGNAPVIESNAFYHYNTTITGYYPAGDATWTAEVLNGSYGATFNWIPYEKEAEEEEETPVYIVAQGSCGANVSWMIMSDGRLIIYGTGAMQFMMRSGAAPWSAYADQITSIEVTAGVESIADNAFTDCSNVTTVSVADTVKSIGAEAFVGCESLETVTFTGDAPEIGENCFEDVSVSIQYPENNTTWTEEVQESFDGDITWVAESCEELGEHNLTTSAIKNTVAATCTQNGFYEEVKSCSACGKEFREIIMIPATNEHSFVNGKCEHCGQISQDWQLGDLDQDGDVDDKDVEYLLWYTLFPETYPLGGIADFDHDGDVDDKDVEYLLWYNLFPEDYPLTFE